MALFVLVMSSQLVSLIVSLEGSYSGTPVGTRFSRVLEQCVFATGLPITFMILMAGGAEIATARRRSRLAPFLTVCAIWLLMLGMWSAGAAAFLGFVSTVER